MRPNVEDLKADKRLLKTVIGLFQSQDFIESLWFVDVLSIVAQIQHKKADCTVISYGTVFQ